MPPPAGAPAGPVVPHLLGRRVRWRRDGGAPDGDHIGLAAGVEHRQRVLAGRGWGAGPRCRRRRRCHRRTRRPTGPGRRPARRGSSRPAGCRARPTRVSLLALGPTRGHDLVDVVVDDGVCTRRYRRSVVGGLVDVDVGPRGHGRDVLDVEDGLVAARDRWAGPPSTVDREAASGRLPLGGGAWPRRSRCRRSRCPCWRRARARRWRCALPAGVPGLVEPEGAVGVGDLVVGEATEGLGVLLGRLHRSGRSGRVGEIGSTLAAGWVPVRCRPGRTMPAGCSWTRSFKPTTEETEPRRSRREARHSRWWLRRWPRWPAGSG
jgi:hypothetical protein